MAFSINTNLGALESYNALAKINDDTTNVQLRLATMKKINSVADDTSGYRVGKELEQINTVQKAQLGNAGSAKNYLSTAESSLSSINDLLTQISAKYTDAQDPSKNKDSIAKDINALATEIDSIMKNSSLNGHNLLANSDGTALSKSDTFDIGGSAFSADFASDSYLQANTLKDKLHGVENTSTSNNTTTAGTPISFLPVSEVNFLDGDGNDIIPDLGGNTSSTTTVKFADNTTTSITFDVHQGESKFDMFLNLSMKASMNNIVSLQGVFSAQNANFVVASEKPFTNIYTSSGYDAASLFGFKYGTTNTGNNSNGAGGLMSTDTDTVLAAASDLSAVQNNVQNALGRIGNLTQTVNVRSDFLSNSITNNTSSISRIFDADMATEQLNATKGSIGSQIATSMLTQLNSAPQQMLSLFR